MICALMVGTLLACGPAQADTEPRVVAQIVDATELHGYVLDHQEYLKPTDVLPSASTSRYLTYVANSAIHEGYFRYFESYDGSVTVSVKLVDFYRNAMAAAISADHPIRVASRLPAGAVVTADSSYGRGTTALRAQFAKGRIQADVTVTAVADNDGGPGSARTKAERALSRASLRQFGKLMPAPQRPGKDTISVSPFRLALTLSVVLAIVLPPLYLAVLTAVRDPAVRRRLVQRFRPPRTVRPLGGFQFADVSEESRRRLRRTRWGTVLRVVLVLAAVLGTFRTTVMTQSVLLLGMALVAAVVGALRARLVRTAGYRVPPYGVGAAVIGILGVGITLLLAGAGCLLVFYSLIARVSGLPAISASGVEHLTSLSFAVGYGLMTFSALPFELTRRLWLRRTQTLLERDGRPPVLLLRSWADDHVRMRSHRSGRHAFLERLRMRRWDRFEEILASALWLRGPVLGLGEPGTRLPPLGAAREYYPEDNWQQGVRDRIDGSCLIVMVVGRTASLVWEIGEIADRNALGKTLFVIPPVPDEERRHRQHVLCAVLGLPQEIFRHIESSGRRVLALCGVGSDSATLITSDVADDVGYEATLDLASDVLERLAATSAGDPADGSVRTFAAAGTRPLPAVDTARLPLVSPGRGAKPPRPWYRRKQVVIPWAGVALTGLLGPAVAAVAPNSTPVPVPGVSVVAGVDAGLLAAHSGHVLFVEHGQDDTLVDLDLATSRQRARLKLPDWPGALTVSGNTAYLTFPASRRMAAVDLGGHTGGGTLRMAWTRSLGRTPGGVAATGHRLLVTFPASDSVALFDGSTGTPLRDADVGKAPMAVTIHRDTAYIAGANDGSVTALRLDSLRRVGTARLGRPLADVVTAGDTVYGIDAADGWIVPVATSGSLHVGSGMRVPRLNGAVAVDEHTLVVSTYRDGTVHAQLLVIQAARHRTVRHILLPESVHDFASDGSQLFVSSPYSRNILRLNPAAPR
ncbi:hypothetical protein AB0D33_29030 [Streptomyces sp. NPDC048404]|uniref:hypothetical protein n=1 Tax=Streptomyces sp. NPDC048404 TaxID=3154721 RepID=UPI0034252E77